MLAGRRIVPLNCYVHGLSGLEPVRRLRAAAPASRVVMLGNSDADVYCAAARNAGAGAYLPSLSSRPALIDMVRHSRQVIRPLSA